MKRLGDVFDLRTVWGNPVNVGDVTVTPQSQALTIRWPSGGLVWNRPIAVLVERGQQAERISIVDTTRLIQIGLFGFTLFLGIVTMALTTRKRRNPSD